MWHDYGGLFAPAAAIINGFIAVVVAQFFKDHPITKLVLVVAAGILGAGAITATFYTQHQIVPDRTAADARRVIIREQLGAFVAVGDDLMQLCQDQKKPVPLQETNDWANRVEDFLRTQLGMSYVYRFRDSTGTPPTQCNACGDVLHQNVWANIYFRVLRLEQFSQETL